MPQSFPHIIEALVNFNHVAFDIHNTSLLMNRVDFKFALTGKEATSLLNKLNEEYDLITKDEQLFRNYETVYFDTLSRDTFSMHHNGKLPRFKIRTRTYMDTMDQFLEVKYKSNKGRTEKKRIKLVSNEGLFEQSGVIDFLNAHQIKNLNELQETLCVKYKRITLIHKNENERVTFDYDMSFNNGHKKKLIEDLVFVEVKQGKPTKSMSISLLKSLNKYPQSISKYCLGLLNMEPFIKHNNFTPLIKAFKKINVSI